MSEDRYNRHLQWRGKGIPIYNYSSPIGENIDETSTTKGGDSDEESLNEIILPVAGATASEHLEPSEIFSSICKREPKQRNQKIKLFRRCASPCVCDEKGRTGALDSGTDATAPVQATSLEQ